MPMPIAWPLTAAMTGLRIANAGDAFCAGHHDGTNIVVLVAVAVGPTEAVPHRARERVASLRAAQRDHRDPIRDLEGQVLVITAVGHGDSLSPWLRPRSALACGASAAEPKSSS
jgi:hypothetical protein